MYSIYSDTNVPDDQGNWDHIYPLSLGGADAFATWASIQQNSIMGSEVDGALAKDPILMLALRHFDVRGQSGNAIVLRWRVGTLEGRPVQVTFDEEKITVWDARDRRELDDAEFSDKPMTANLRISKHAALRFVAKAALGGGYFLYKDAFKEGVDCAALRALVFLNLEKAKAQGTFDNSHIKFCDRFHPDSERGDGLLYRVLCQSVQRSIFIAVPHHDTISFHVGIVGEYIGSIIVPAVTTNLPNDGEHDLGHVIIMQPGDTQRLSLRKFVKGYHDAMEAEKAKAETKGGDEIAEKDI